MTAAQQVAHRHAEVAGVSDAEGFFAQGRKPLVAQGVGASPRAFAIAVAIAASCSFLTPIGYQTNTMVYGPGGYRFSDYARLGAPLTALVLAGVVLLTLLFGSS